MRKAAVKDARSARRVAGASDENDQRTVNSQTRADESYPWSYQASSNANAFMTPDHDKQQTQRHQQQRQDYEWHYQEMPPAQIQHSRQPTTYRPHAEEADDDGDGVDDDDDDAARGFKTPEPDSRAARRPPTTHAPANNHSTTHTSDDGEQQHQTAAEFAQSQYRRRNRLEKRLEELQKDVASLTLKLRSSSNRSNSTGYLLTDKQITPPPAPLSEVPLNSERVNRGGERQSMQTLQQQPQMQRKVLKPSSPVVKIKKTRADKPRTIRSSEYRSSHVDVFDLYADTDSVCIYLIVVETSDLSEHSTTPTKGRMSSHVSVSTMRELHKVTTERDQLKFELEKMKRALTTTTKKYEEAVKASEALEKLKAHCESLQESLDLSEKIRVRQKKLLQQLQLNQQQARAQQMQQQQQAQKPRRTAEAPPTAAPLRSREAPAAVRSAMRKKRTSTNHPTSDLAHDARSRYSTQQYQQLPEYDILDSLVNQRPHPFNARASTHNHQRLGHRTTTATATRSALHAGTAPHSRTTAATGFTYADFDSLLQKVHSPHPYTMMAAQPSAATAISGKQQSTRLSRRDHQQPEISAANPSGTIGRIRSKSQGPPTTAMRTRPTSAGASSTKAKRSSSLLAPTQASLQRMHAQQRRPDEHRRPFI